MLKWSVLECVLGKGPQEALLRMYADKLSGGGMEFI